MELPIIHSPVLFLDNFRRRGGPFPDHWTVASGSFSTDNERSLLVELPGEIVYSGTSLDQLRTRNVTDSANYAIFTGFIGQTDLKFEIRGRRLNSTTHYAFAIDFEDHTATFTQTPSDLPGDAAYSTSVSHQFKPSGRHYYQVSLWMFELYAFCIINNYKILEIDFNQIGANNNNTNASLERHGFSLFVPEVNTEDIPEFHYIAALELTEQPDPSLDPTDVFVVFREQLRDWVDPSELNWETYKNAYRAWEKGRNYARSDGVWKNLGYPLPFPATEKWFA